MATESTKPTRGRNTSVAIATTRKKAKMISHILTALFMSLLAIWGLTYLAIDFDRTVNEREGE
jgi:hypothetical protein